jgi:hypothetical protein
VVCAKPSLFSLDTVGLAGFSHDFGALAGEVSPVWKAFDDMSNYKMGIGDAIVLILWPVTTFIRHLPTPRQKAINDLREACTVLAKALLDNTDVEEKHERSIMGLLGVLTSSLIPFIA